MPGLITRLTSTVQTLAMTVAVLIIHVAMAFVVLLVSGALYGLFFSQAVAGGLSLLTVGIVGKLYRRRTKRTADRQAESPSPAE